MASSPSPAFAYVGRGELFFDRFDSSGKKTGEFSLGNCGKFAINAQPETIECKSSLTSIGGTYARAVTALKYTIEIEGFEFSPDNVAIQSLGWISSYSQSASTITGETITASSVQGRWYPVSKRSLSSVVVKVGASAKTLGTDYNIDATLGRIYIVPGGGITDGSTVTVDASAAAITAKAKIIAGTNPSITGFLRFVGDPVYGERKHVQCWRVSLSPGGSGMAYISEDFATWSLSGEVLYDGANHPSEPWYTEETL